MSEYSIVENPSAELWNSFLSTSSEGNFQQCFENGEIAKMGFPRTESVRLAIMYNGKPAGIVQGMYPNHFGFGMTLRVRNGPIVNLENISRLLIVENLLRALEDYGKRNRIIHAEIWAPESWQLYEVFHKLGYSRSDRINEYVVDLKKGADELWRTIVRNKRRNIKKAAKEEVEIIHSRDPDDLLTFYSMLESSAERGGFSILPLSWFKAAWKVYKPEELSKVFLARWRGKIVSGVFIVICGKTVYALAAGSLKEGWKARPNDIMHWKVMEWACRNGYSEYHMGLVSDPPPTEGSNAWGIWRWKREWNGNLRRIIIFKKFFAPRYKLILKAKELVERSYNSLRRWV